MQTFRFSYIWTWRYYSAVINHLITHCTFFDDTNSNKMNFSPKLLVKFIYFFSLRQRWTQKKASREIKGKETRTVQNVKEEAGAGRERGDGNRGRDRDKLAPWHCVISILCRLKCFMQVEISIKCCSNFLFKPTSWLNRQIIHRLNSKAWSEWKSGFQFWPLVWDIWTWRRTEQVCKVWGWVSTTPRNTEGSEEHMNPNLNGKQWSCLFHKFFFKERKQRPKAPGIWPKWITSAWQLQYADANKQA